MLILNIIRHYYYHSKTYFKTTSFQLDVEFDGDCE